MEFIKKHYEKVLLGVVLLGLAAGAVFLILMIPAERAAQLELVDTIIKKPGKQLPPLDLGKQAALIGHAAGADCLDLASTNKVFNPLQWQRMTDGSLKKIVFGNEVGVGAVVVSKITPLYTIITLDSATMTADGSARYLIGVEREAAAKVSQRGKKQAGATLNAKTETFVIREVKGSPDNPTELVLEMNDTGDRLPLSKEKPIRRVDGYMADFNYPPELSKKWKDQRVGAGAPGMLPITIAGESYIVVAINKNEVVLSARSNNKKTPRPYSPAP
ncbi:MAG: hypothetical protein EXS35_06650 [Pedosphaera sp.]|nr:hypothetical protein [Pedosphaera sp.]